MQIFSSSTRRHQPGFALVVTLSLMILLTVIAVGLLTLSSISLRTSSRGEPMAQARANARLGLMLAIGEVQKSMGIDQRISAPSGILDSDPNTAAEDGLANPHLTGVWNARDATKETLASLNTTPPDYSRDKPNFQRWLISNSNPEAVENLNFAQTGTLANPVNLAGSANSELTVKAGKVAVKNGSYAWWVGDENCKAQISRRDLLARESNPAIAALLASFATPGANGIKALEHYESFAANSPTSDKFVTRDELAIMAPPGVQPRELFHDVTPYAQSILTNVTTGSLRKDLSLYLERTDIDWLKAWKNTNWQSGPLGPNGLVALSPLAEYDVLAWKTLHHYYNMNRQVAYVGRRPRVTAIDSNPIAGPFAPINPESNPEWNSGVTMITPVIVHMQYLLSYGVQKAGRDYDLFVYSYPVVTLWNPYNVDMRINGMNIFLHNLPLSHKIYKNNAATTIPDFKWQFATNTTGGTLVMRFGQPYGSPAGPIILKAGEQKIFNSKSFVSGTFDIPAANMAENSDPSSAYSYQNAGHPRQVPGGKIIGALGSDLISLETKMGTWETVGTSYAGMQSTFEVRSEPRGDHMGNDARMPLQGLSSVYAWRFENSSPSSNQLSKANFPSKTLRELTNAPTPFCLIDVRLKPLDEVPLPDKTWLQNIPALTYAGCTSATNGADAKTPFFSHPYTVTFDQRTTVQGLFPTIPYMGPSYTPAGQRFVADREIPLVPLSSLAQLQNLPQYSMESMNRSNLFQQNHAIGNSYASPGIPSNKIKSNGWPFYLSYYVNSQQGDVTGRKIGDDQWITGVSNIDRSYAANHLLWDDYYFSSMAPQTSTFYQQFGATRNLKEVVDQFYGDTKALPNSAYVPYLAGKTAKEVEDSLVNTGGNPLPDAYQKSAAYLMASGGFNVNSTSVPAWTIMLASTHLKRPVIMDSAGTGGPAAPSEGNFIVSRFAMPIGGTPGQTSTEDMRWCGYRELTANEIRQLAEAIVRQVKQRGPFRSLGEFINRRLASASDDKALYGALQAALEDPKVDINKDYRNMTITDADLAGTNYAFKKAALGPRYQGTPAYISQADILQPIAPILNARSDTFLIRSYGEALSPDGKTVLAKAWCEAVVQRYPDYLDPEDKPETPMTASSLKPVNKIFGRRFVLKSFRWLSPNEI